MPRVLTSIAILVFSYVVGNAVGSHAPARAQLEESLEVQRALVLGSGGPLARAWEAGVLKGLLDAGVDLSAADTIVGSSAGAIVGAQLRSGRSIDDLFLAAMSPPTTAGPSTASRTEEELQYFQETSRMWSGAPESAEQRVRIGERALLAPNPVPESTQMATAVRNAGTSDWPERGLRIAAVDVANGSVWFFERIQAVPFNAAVAASSSQPGLHAPITVGDRRFMDGGIAGGNMIGAVGYPVVVGLTPFPGERARLQDEIDSLRLGGSRVVSIVADEQAREAMGRNLNDASRMPTAAQEGLRQAAAVAEDVRAVWEISMLGVVR